MTQDDETPAEDRPARRRRRRGLGLAPAVAALLLTALVALAGLSVSGRAVSLPDWVVSRIEAHVSKALPLGPVSLERAEFLISPEGQPQVRFRDVRISDAGGSGVAQVNAATVEVSARDLVAGRVAFRRFGVSGAQVTIRRDAQGVFTLSFGGAPGTFEGSIAGVLEGVGRTFSQGPLSGLSRIEAGDVTITLEDARSGRIWQATGGALALTNAEDGIGLSVTAEVFNGTEDLARVQLNFRSTRDGRGASLGVSFENAASRDLALQSPALSFLSLIDAPISGAMRAGIAETGAIEELAATLEIGAGTLVPGDAAPVPFDGARTYLAFQPQTGRVEFTELSVRSSLVSASTEGYAYLDTGDDAWPERLIGQFRLNAVEVADAGVFEGPVLVEDGRADFRLTLDPLEVEIGQVVVDDGAGEIRLAGHVAAGSGGWTAALDLSSDSLSTAQVLRYWPLGAAPGTRKWVAGNVLAGTIEDLSAHLRIAPGRRPVVGMTFGFEGADAGVLRDFPPITGGAGRATLIQDRFALAMTSGTLALPGRQPVDLAGSTFRVGDITRKPGIADVALRGEGDLGTVLRLVDRRPFRFMTRSGQSPDLARAGAAFTARLEFPLKPRIVPTDVNFTVDGVLTDVASETLMGGRSLAAETLDVAVGPGGLQVSGEARIDGLAVDAVWANPFGEPGSTATADVVLDADALDALGVALPPGAVTGAAPARIELTLRPDEPMDFTLTSDLVGAALAIPALGWRKAAATPGQLSVSGTAGERLTVEALELDAPGLDVMGRILPGDGPGRQVVDLSRVRAGTWFDAPVRITGRGTGRAPDVRVTGGTIDLRGRPDVSAGAGGGPPLRLSLDRLRVADALALAPFSAEITTGGGLSGRFEGRVNGAAPVSGTVAPARNGTAVRVLSDDAGRALSALGLGGDARGGSLELTLIPDGRPGSYDGTLAARSVRITDAPLIASLLDAVSIVGLLDELGGSGIHFENLDARFDLSPDRIVVREGSAVGASLGISLDGIYRFADKRMDFQGVVSPIYLINAVGQVFTRRGEGLFGFNFRVTGAQGNASVQVNPLSILTPGMFREIFRRPLPQRLDEGP